MTRSANTDIPDYHIYTKKREIVEDIKETAKCTEQLKTYFNDCPEYLEAIKKAAHSFKKLCSIIKNSSH
jgi:hypothetical protein